VTIASQLERLRLSGKKAWAGLVDPDESDQDLPRRIGELERGGAFCILVGGSYSYNPHFTRFALTVKSLSALPVVLFPGDARQIAPVDAILFLTLISGRNPDYLIGKQVEAAPFVKDAVDSSGMEVIPTGYMLFDTGRPTTAGYITATPPLPPHKPELAAYTGLAGKYLGLKTLYLDAGSGAAAPLPHDVVCAVSRVAELPLIVGGGIKTPHAAEKASVAGADLVVVGTALERSNPQLIADLKTLYA
jgi:putative glycerol-1-phosphate prenyltransferase